MCDALQEIERDAWRAALASGSYEALGSEPSENGDVEAMVLDDPQLPRVSTKDR